MSAVIGANSASTPKQPSPVHKALARLTEECRDIHSEVCRLRESISPILMPMPDKPYSDIVCPAEDDCDLVKVLNDSINNLCRTIHLIRETTEQVAL